MGEAIIIIHHRQSLSSSSSSTSSSTSLSSLIPSELDMIPFLMVAVVTAFEMICSSRVAAFGHIHMPPSQPWRSRPRRFSLRSLLKMAGDQPSDGAREGIRYLGSGENAIIRPGVVLVAPNHEYDHFLMRSAVFVYAIGLDENESTIIRGVVLDHPTAFTIGEMSPNVMGGLAQNQLFRGGYDGSDTAMLLHSAGGSGASVKSDTMIGSSGIFEGGIVSAMESADAGVIEPSDCKFFFNYMQFTEKELSNMFAGSEDGDEWVSLEIPTDYVLDSDYERGELWSKLRNNIRGIRGRP